MKEWTSLGQKLCNYALVAIVVTILGLASKSYALGNKTEAYEKGALDFNEKQIYVGPNRIANGPSYETNEVEPPSKVWNLATQGRYKFNGKAEISNLFANINFKGKSSVYVHVVNDSKTQAFDVIVYEKGKVFERGKDLVTKTINGGSELNFYVSNLDPSKQYGLYFFSPCDFHGYIE